MLLCWAEQFMGFLEPLRNGDVLRTGFHAISAVKTSVSPLLFFEPRWSAVTEPGWWNVVVGNRIIIKLEDTRNLHTIGTGHTVPTTSARYRAYPAVRLPNPFDEGKLLCC